MDQSKTTDKLNCKGQARNQNAREKYAALLVEQKEKVRQKQRDAYNKCKTSKQNRLTSSIEYASTKNDKLLILNNITVVRKLCYLTKIHLHKLCNPIIVRCRKEDYVLNTTNCGD